MNNNRHQSGKWLAFVGPITMSFGGFFIVFSFVVVCELREKLDHARTKREKSSKRFKFKSFDLLDELAQSRKRKEKQLLVCREKLSHSLNENFNALYNWFLMKNMQTYSKIVFNIFISKTSGFQQNSKAWSQPCFPVPFPQTLPEALNFWNSPSFSFKTYDIDALA